MPDVQRSAFYRLFSSPSMAFAGSVASIIGLGLAVYFYRASIQRPELTYYFHPVRATVVSAGQSTALSFSYNGKKLDRDVSTVQVAIWNAGTSPLRHEDLLSPITIQSRTKAPILEATLRRTSRPEIAFTLDATIRDKGIITLDWKVLEHNDGASIQLIYLGTPAEVFEVSGSVIGQHGITERRFSSTLKSAQEQFEKDAGRHSDGWTMLGTGVFMGISIGMLLFFQRRRGQSFAWYDGAIVAIVALQIAIGIWLVAFRPDDSPPPFGF